MAQSLSLSGTIAQIIQHPRAAAHPVVQKRGPGRNPKKVVRLSTFKINKSVERILLRERQEAEANLRGVIKTCEGVIHNARYELAMLTQSVAKGQS